MYFYEAGSSSKQLHFQKNNFFRSRNFLRTATFPEKLVLRNQPHSICTWKGFPLASIHSFKYSRGRLTLKFLSCLLLKIENNVLIPIKDALQMLLFRKVIIIVIYSNKLWKIGIANSEGFVVQRANDEAMKFWKVSL